MSYEEYQESEGIHARKFIVGDKETDYHTHILYVRDDLPRATSSDAFLNNKGHHAHSIEEGPDGTFVCRHARQYNHVHTKFTEVVNDG